MSRTTLLLADDHVLFIEGLVCLLKERFAILGAVHDGLSLLEEAHRLRPQVIVTDLSMPRISGLEVVRRLTAELPEIRVVVLTMHADPVLGAEALRSGAAGFVLKESTGGELVAAIEDAMRGRVYLSPAVTGGILSLLAAPSDGTELRLTPRQREVLRLVVDGRRMKEVAASLGISSRTAETIKYDLMRTLDVHSTAELVRYAIQHRLVHL